MIEIRKSDDRGHYDHGWLQTAHSFSFARYFDPKYKGFSDLLVINEDTIKGGEGFGKHYHDNMEIITYVTQGALNHKDSMGNAYTINTGDVQVMSAGTGIMHSEFNASETQDVHLFQIWIVPNMRQIKPSYSQKNMNTSENLTLIASPDGENDSFIIHQNAKLYLLKLEKDQDLSYKLDKNRNAWIQIVDGKVDINGIILDKGDGAAISQENLLTIKSLDNCEALLFDLK